MTDIEKIVKLRNDEHYFGQVYRDHRDYALRFMSKIHNDHEVIQDVYQDAIIVLYENVKKPGFQLSCSIQTYLNSICRNQLLNKHKKMAKMHLVDSNDYDNSINDWFENDEFDPEKEERITVLENALHNLKEKGEKCFEILKRYFYSKQSMDEIASEMGYTNGDNVKNQKSRCQKRLREMVMENYSSN
jgi:RNA polymerase sigma factor (sigma-70 family)